MGQQYVISVIGDFEINISPTTEVEEILQNVRMILSTQQFSVPLNRGFGLSSNYLDKPIPVAKAMVIAEVMDAIEKYEPRATVETVTFDENAEPGKLIPRVEVII